MPPGTRVHKVKKGSSKNPPPKLGHEAASGSQQQQPQHKTDPQEQNIARPATSSPAIARPQEHHPSSASWILHDVPNVSGPMELMCRAGLYFSVGLALTLFALRYVVGPLIGDYIDLPCVTMEPGNVGVVKELDPDILRIMWCSSAFTSFNVVLGLITEERGGVIRLIRPPVAVFCFLFSGVIDMFRVEQWSPTQLIEYKHMRDRGRVENWACYKKFLRLGLVLKTTILCWALRRLWQEWRRNYLMRRNYNIDFLKIFRRKEQNSENIPAKDCVTKKKSKKQLKREARYSERDYLIG